MDFRSRDHGGSQEFSDYQLFTPGENIRHLDWNRYQRDGSLFVRQYERLERPEVTLVADLSRSIVVGKKVDDVKHFSAAFGFCLLNRGLTVRLYANGRFQRYMGWAGFQQMNLDIERLESGQQPILSLQKVAAKFSSHVIVVSDLIFSEGYEQFKQNLNLGNRSAFLFQLSSPSDRQPPQRGDYRLQDAQNNADLPCCIDEAMIERYRQCRQAYYHQIEAECLKKNWQYREIDTADNLKNQFLSVAPSGILFL